MAIFFSSQASPCKRKSVGSSNQAQHTDKLFIYNKLDILYERHTPSFWVVNGRLNAYN
jgi:hypothetical protein